MAHRTRVYLVRHAKAEAEHDRGDAARRLTAEGRERFRGLLADLDGDLRVSRILTSPYVRARQTAEILGAVAGRPVEEERALESSRSTGRELLRLAAEAGPGTALVGHNPEIAEAVSLAARRVEEVKPGSVAAIDLTPAGPVLVWLRRPPRLG